MRAMALSSILVDSTTVGKIARLANATQGEPTDDTCETLACILLDAALEAALLEFEDRNGGVQAITPESLKFSVFSGTSNMRVEISGDMEASLERLAAVAGYKDGVGDLLLESVIAPESIIDAAAMTLINIEATTRKEIGAIAAVAFEERLRHSKHDWDKATVRDIIDKKGGKKP